MLVRMRYSHALRFVPSRNWWKDAYALAYVSCTRSSASAGLRVMRSAAEYIWSRKVRASRSKRALRSTVLSAGFAGSRAWPSSVPASVPVTGPTSSKTVAGPDADPLESENRRRSGPAAAPAMPGWSTRSVDHWTSAACGRDGHAIEPMREVPIPLSVPVRTYASHNSSPPARIPGERNGGPD